MEFHQITDGLRFPEGPVALPDGDFLVVEIEAGTLTRVEADGRKEVVASPGGGPNGAAIGPDGKCYVCNNGGFEWQEEAQGRRPIGQAKDYSGGRIERVDLTSGEVEVLYTHAAGDIALKGPNDIVFDAHGGFWFTDLGKLRRNEQDRGRVFYAKADGSEWQDLMVCFGADPRATFDLDISDIPQRRQATHPYRCDCQFHEISTTRHNRIRRGKGRYLCRHCDGELVYTPQGELLDSMA